MNGLRINVDKDDFISKPEAERSWIMFEAIQHIDQNGCKWSQEQHRKESWSKIKTIGVGIGAGLGAAVAIWQMMIH